MLIGQMVNLLKDGEPLRMSKRAGTIVTLHDLVDAIGVDAAPLRAGALLRPTHRSTSTSTCWTKATSDNPVFYVQYAHARVCLDPAQRRRPRAGWRAEASTPRCSPTSRRASCCGRSPSFPRVVARRAQLREPHRVARYLEDTAASLPQVLRQTAGCCRWATRSPADLHRARLLLVAATRTVLANGLGLLGVSAPERM